MTVTREHLELIPAIDLLGGEVVRLYQGDFDQVTQYSLEPLALARRYIDAGATRLHIVDLDGARTGEAVNRPVIEALAKLSVDVQMGGGIRSAAVLHSLLDAGVARAVIGSEAVREPDRVIEWIGTAGAEKIIIALDIRLDDDGEPEVLTDGWTCGSGQRMWPLVERFAAAGVREFLCTDIARDGTLAGPNLELYQACVSRHPDAEFIASGGVGGVEDLEALERTGIARVVAGKALLDGRLSLAEIERFSRDA